MTTLTVYTHTTPSGDSAYQATAGTVTVGATNNSFNSSAYPYAGMRFENITIAGGSTISSAAIAVWGQSSKDLGPPTGTMKGVLATNPGVFTTAASSLSTLYTGSPTTNSASISGTISTSAYVTIATVTSIITELIGQGGWSSGNAMAFVGDATNSTPANWFQSGNSVNYEQLTITYTAGATYYPPKSMNIGQAVNRASTY